MVLSLLFWIALVLLSGATLSSFGGHFDIGYFDEYRYFCYMYFYISLVLILLNRIQRSNLHTFLTKSTIFFVFLLTIILGLQINTYANRSMACKGDANKFYVETLGGYLPVEYKKHVDMAKQFPKDEVIEEYWGLWSALSNNVGSSNLPVDSVIHALGSTRHKYLQILEKLPDRVITTPYSHSHEWQPWNFSLDYWFYKVLLENYEPIQTSPSTLVWNKSVNKKGSEILCKVNATRNQFSLVTETSGYYEVILEADVSLKKRSLALIRNNINYAASSGGYISTDPESNLFVFPVLSSPNDKIFDIKFSQPEENVGNTFKISSCKTFTIPRLHSQVTPINTKNAF